jgi:hypothetical protein
MPLDEVKDEDKGTGNGKDRDRDMSAPAPVSSEVGESAKSDEKNEDVQTQAQAQPQPQPQPQPQEAQAQPLPQPQPQEALPQAQAPHTQTASEKLAARHAHASPSSSPSPSDVAARLGEVVSDHDTFLSSNLRRAGLAIYGYKDNSGASDAVKERLIKMDDKGRLYFHSSSFKSSTLFGSQAKWPLPQLVEVVVRRNGMGGGSGKRGLDLGSLHPCANKAEITLRFREGAKGNMHDSAKRVGDLIFFCLHKKQETQAIKTLGAIIEHLERDKDGWMRLYAPSRGDSSSNTTPSGSNINSGAGTPLESEKVPSVVPSSGKDRLSLKTSSTKDK